MHKFKKLSVLLVLLATILTSCQVTKDDDFENSNESSADYSATFSDVSEFKDTSEIFEAFDNAYKIEKQFVDFLINRSIIDEGNLDIYYEEAPFIYYKLPFEHVYSTEDNLRKLFEDIYYDVDKTLDELLDYPEYGPKALSIDNGYIIVSDNYRGKVDFNVDLDSVNLKDYYDDSAVLEFFGLDGNVEAQISMKTKDGEWVLEKSIFNTILQAQEEKLLNETNWLDNITDGAMNNGTAKRLYGKCLVINVFISDSETAFDKSDIDGVLNYLEEALDYLEEQALYYDADLEMEYTDADSSIYFDLNDEIVDNLYNFQWTNSMFEKNGYTSLEGFILENFDTSVLERYDNYCVMLHINKPGRSYALQCNSDYYDSDNYFTERAVMFYSIDKNYEYFVCPATYAHEILHLYGAIDLYFPNDSDDTRAELAESYFWKEIMRYIPADNINDAKISKFTAFKIGLYPYLENQIQIFDVAQEALLNVTNINK